MKRISLNLLRLAGISALTSVVAMLIGAYLQEKKGDIDIMKAPRQFDSLMRMYYLGTTIGNIAAWALLISLVIGIVAGVLYLIKRRERPEKGSAVAK